ncbi:MAG: ABC transporter substrate-binding protein [Synergistaceae bacterium]|jgi:peptide/nickel transport system substrate-binding protein|nr:ABC transporter substrate-binding protein [Synergistaceae bacterium]
MKKSKGTVTAACYLGAIIFGAAILLGALASPGESAASSGESDSIIRYTMTTSPIIDPGVGSDLSSTSVILNLYDTLVFPQHDGSMAPNVATEWAVSNDRLVWDFKLRTDVKFHSGNPLTAADVVYTMNRLTTVGEGYGYLFRDRVVEAIALDDSTVRFVLNKPYGPFISTLTRLYLLDSKLLLENQKAGDYGEHGDYSKGYLLEHDAGSGPYKLLDQQIGSHLLAEKFEGYWNGHRENTPKQFKLIASNEAVTVKTAISRKELEIADQYQSSENIDAMAQMPGIEVNSANTGYIMVLTMNNRKAPTDDAHYRKAVAYMIDYASICENVFPGSVKSNSLVPPSLLGYSDKMFPYGTDLEKAKEELALSKYANELDKYPLEVAWVAETPSREKLALSVQASAMQIGIPVKIVKTPWASIVEKAASMEATPNCVTVGVPPTYSEAGSIFESQVRSKAIGTWESCSWINDPKADEMIEDALGTFDTEERKAKYIAIQEYLADICPLIPVCEQPENCAYQASYVEWNAASPEEIIPVTGYKFWMSNIYVYPERR